MNGDVHVRFCESGEVRFLPATHPNIFDIVEVDVPRHDLPAPWRHGEWTGRVTVASSAVYAMPRLDTTASRFAPESVAGLVVGAWGLFIFGLYLRRWLAERRGVSGDAVEAPQPDSPPIR